MPSHVSLPSRSGLSAPGPGQAGLGAHTQADILHKVWECQGRPQLAQTPPPARHTQVLPRRRRWEQLLLLWSLHSSPACFGRGLYYGHYLLLIVQDRTQHGSRPS